MMVNLPSRFDDNSNPKGAVIAEVVNVELEIKPSYKGLKVTIKVNNFDLIDEVVTILVFYNSKGGVSAEGFLEFMGTTSVSELKGSLMYCILGENASGYKVIDNLCMKIDKGSYYFDPRTATGLTCVKLENGSEDMDIFF